MKHRYFSFAILLSVFFVLCPSAYAVTDGFEIYLDYDIPTGTELVFSEDTTLAIFIEGMWADGRAVPTFQDVRDIPICNVECMTAAKKTGRIKMVWDKRGDFFVWNDGRGIVFTENESGYFVPKTNSYRFSATVRTLKIKYKVLIPPKEIDTDALLKSHPNDGTYSDTRVLTLKLRKLRRIKP